jgi:hypothetical protein
LKNLGQTSINQKCAQLHTLSDRSSAVDPAEMDHFCQ